MSKKKFNVVAICTTLVGLSGQLVHLKCSRVNKKSNDKKRRCLAYIQSTFVLQLRFDSMFTYYFELDWENGSQRIYILVGEDESK